MCANHDWHAQASGRCKPALPQQPARRRRQGGAATSRWRRISRRCCRYAHWPATGV